MNDTISRQWLMECVNEGWIKFDTEKDENRFIHLVRDIAPSAQPEQQWIPCSERLPEHGGRYLISVLDGTNRRTTVAPYLPRCKAWAMNGRMAYWKVIAWLPLPEPYSEEEQDG